MSLDNLSRALANFRRPKPSSCSSSWSHMTTTRRASSHIRAQVRPHSAHSLAPALIQPQCRETLPFHSAAALLLAPAGARAYLPRGRLPKQQHFPSGYCSSAAMRHRRGGGGPSSICKRAHKQKPPLASGRQIVRPWRPAVLRTCLRGIARGLLEGHWWLQGNEGVSTEIGRDKSFHWKLQRVLSKEC